MNMQSNPLLCYRSWKSHSYIYIYIYIYIYENRTRETRMKEYFTCSFIDSGTLIPETHAARSFPSSGSRRSGNPPEKTCGVSESAFMCTHGVSVNVHHGSVSMFQALTAAVQVSQHRTLCVCVLGDLHIPHVYVWDSVRTHTHTYINGSMHSTFQHAHICTHMNVYVVKKQKIRHINAYVNVYFALAATYKK